MTKITNESEYAQASDRADTLYGAAEGTPQKQELDELLAALRAYEADFVRMLKENGWVPKRSKYSFLPKLFYYVDASVLTI